MAEKGVTGDFFFHFCKIIFFLLKRDNIFMGGGGGGGKLRPARLASVLATRWTGNRFFFMDSLRHESVNEGTVNGHVTLTQLDSRSVPKYGLRYTRV